MRFALCISLLSLVFVAGCSREQENAQASTKAPEPVAVQTARAETRVLDRSIFVTGSLNPEETVSVSSEVPGRVAAIHVDFGHDVKKGQVIAELDRQELNLQLE